MNVYLHNLRLPSAYQEVEYIQSSGTQYINTGYIPSNNTKIEMSMGGWVDFAQFQSLFGCRASWSTDASTGRGFMLGKNTYNGDYTSMFGRKYAGSGDGVGGFTFGDGNNHIIQFSQSGFYDNGTLIKTPNTVTFTSPVNLLLFVTNTNGLIEEYGYFKLYYCRLWNNGTLVRDFVPCYRKSDSVIGMYDLVNNQFYTNSGTGTFSKGNDVTMAELKNAYIGNGLS